MKITINCGCLFALFILFVFACYFCGLVLPN